MFTTVTLLIGHFFPQCSLPRGPWLKLVRWGHGRDVACLLSFLESSLPKYSGVVKPWRASVTKSELFLFLRNFNFNRSEVKAWVYFEGEKNCPSIHLLYCSMKDIEIVKTEKAWTLKNPHGCGLRAQGAAQGCLLGHYLYQKLGNTTSMYISRRMDEFLISKIH